MQLHVTTFVNNSSILMVNVFADSHMSEQPRHDEIPQDIVCGVFDTVPKYFHKIYIHLIAVCCLRLLKFKILCGYVDQFVHSTNSSIYLSILYIRLGQKGVNFGNSLMASGVCYIGSKDEDVVKYFWKKMCLPMPNLIWNLCSELL